MLQKLLILSLLTTTALAQDPMLICTLGIVNNVCTCNLLMFNPNGFNNLTVTGNPLPNCTFESAVQAIGIGISTNIPAAICAQLPNLERLVLENVGIQHLNGNGFRACGNLRTLQLGWNAIESVPINVFSTTNLERIELNDNRLRNFDEHSFDNLRNLRTLNISGNSDGMLLPGGVFDHLTSLQNLFIARCDLSSLNVRWFVYLRSLMNLDLSSNKFASIPLNSFNFLTNLRWLDLSRGELAAIPETTFRNTAMLMVLDLSSNKISELPSNLFTSQLSLLSLNLSNNINTTFPADVFSPLIFLRILDLGSNNITALDDWFSSLQNLVNINLSNNAIPEIPEYAFNTTNILETINFSGNRLTKLDSRSFGPLQRLQHINCQNNQINEVDYYFMSQPTLLRSVNFSNNLCTQLNTDNFSLFRTVFLNQMRMCFDNFDRNPILLSTFNSTIYDWHSIRSHHGWDALEVTVKAFENVHVAFSDSVNGRNLVEIQIGENRNRQSNILDQGEVVFRDDIRGRLSETEERSFIIGWRFGIVMVFRKGFQIPFMAYSKQGRFSVNFFGLRTMIKDGTRKAEWKVSRLQLSSRREMWKVYEDIEADSKRGVPIDLNQYLR